MSFVYNTDGSLPDGKVDGVPSAAPVNKRFRATEWNQVMAAVKDLRTAVLAITSAAGVVLADAIEAAVATVLGNGSIQTIVLKNQDDGSEAVLSCPPFGANYLQVDADLFLVGDAFIGDLTFADDGNTLSWPSLGAALTAVPGSLTTAAVVSQFNMRMRSLGVGNAVSASTPGTVTHKMEVFDASGASLGFVPIYNSIT